MELEYLIAEIGSTTTVVNAFKKESEGNLRFVAQGQSATTVLQGDVNIGLQGAIVNLKENLGIKEFFYKEMLATSSAAGGLRMTVHGLVYDMTVKAAKEAVLGAGANIKFITAGKLTKFDLKKIKEINPNIILVAGGVDYGERETALYNSEKIAELNLNTPVIFAGNIACQEDVKSIFEENNQGEFLEIIENVYPKIDELNVEPVRKKVQNIFEKNIIYGPGMQRIKEMVTGHIMPTPGAVMEATKVFYEKLGDVMTFDVGGATTDVSSVTEGSEIVRTMLNSPEPIAKRSVEGDLGCFISRKSVVKISGIEKLCKEIGIIEDEGIKKLEELSPIPITKIDVKIARFLTKESVAISLNRHSGSIKKKFDGSTKKVASGKDLTAIKYIIGTGGALTRLPLGEDILRNVLKNNNGEKLFPGEMAHILIDKEYIMASVGVLSLKNKELAFNLLKMSLGV